jgi:fluoride exporter
LPGLEAIIYNSVKRGLSNGWRGKAEDILRNYFLVFAGGGLGAALRYWVSGIVHGRFGGGFPLGTLSVNVLGCIAIGLLMSLLEERFLVYPGLRIFLTVGVLGGFTTFSSFSYETIAMLREGQFFYSGVNIAASLGACLCGTWIGLHLGKTI